MTLDEVRNLLIDAMGCDFDTIDPQGIHGSIELATRFPHLNDAIAEILGLNDAEQEQTSANRRGSPTH